MIFFDDDDDGDDDYGRIKSKFNIGVLAVVAIDLVTNVDFVVVIVYFLAVHQDNIITFYRAW